MPVDTDTDDGAPPDPWSVPLSGLLGKTADALAAGLGITTAGGLLDHVPRRYAERGELTAIRGLMVGENATVLARVERVAVHRYVPRAGGRGGQGAGGQGAGGQGGGGRGGPTRERVQVVITDGRDTLELAFFRSRGITARLPVGRYAMFAGQVSEFRGTRQLVHPDFRLLDPAPDPTLEPAAPDPALDPALEPAAPDPALDPAVADYVGRLLPVYPATAAAPTWTVAEAVKTVLDSVEIPDPVPAGLLAARGLCGLAEAFAAVHRPADRAQLERGRDRLRFDDALVPQLVLALRRDRARRSPAVPRPRVPGGLRDRFDAALPFRLTDSQRHVGDELDADLARDAPMHRLLQGEVGSGKTVVALRAMLAAVDAGGQAALLAPTEALANQHARSLAALLGPLGRGGMLDGDPAGTRVALLTGSLSTAARRVALLDIASGAAGLVVGTHALLADRVSFAELGLLVVDEQHRFGVGQRAALSDPGSAGAVPHQLVMTATPIPRTVAMTVFGDLAVSTLSQVPGGRPPVATTVVPAGEKPAWVARAWSRVVEEVRAGHQAFVVAPRIGGDDEDEGPLDESGRRRSTALLDLVPTLVDGPLAGLRCAVLHGRLPAEERDAVLRAFGAGDIDVLLATTVVEVGIDIPNATVMVVVDAERFGMSQLHQLRGRVGRGPAGGVCLLLTEAPAGSPGRARVEAVAASSDGFELAEADLRERREGDLLGATQSGTRTSFRVLSVLDSPEVIADARAAASALVGADPMLAGHPRLLAHLRSALPAERVGFLAQG